MAAKSLLLSCLLMGLGAAQHPASEVTQTQSTPSEAIGSACSFSGATSSDVATETSAAGSAGSMAITEPIYLPEVDDCDPWEVRQVLQDDFAPGTFCTCAMDNPYWRKPGERKFQECDETTTMDLVTGYLSDFEEKCPYPDIVPFVCTSFEERLRACASRPHAPECQHFSKVLKRFGSPYWDDDKVNSHSSITPDDQSEGLHRRQDVPAVESKPTHQDTLQGRDAEEPYHPILKPIYEDCDALEDPDLHAACVVIGIQRALCEREPWITGCENMWSDGDDDLPFKPAVSDLNEDGSLGQPQVITVPIEVLVDCDVLSPPVKEILQECKQPADYDILLRCMQKVHEVCSKNPAEKLFQASLERS